MAKNDDMHSVDSMKLTQCLLKELGYEEKLSTQYLTHVQKGVTGKISLPIAEFGPTFILKVSEDEVHCLTLIIFQKDEHKIPLLSSYFGHKENGLHRLDNPTLDALIPPRLLNIMLTISEVHPSQLLKDTKQAMIDSKPPESIEPTMAQNIQWESAVATLHEQMKAIKEKDGSIKYNA